MSKVGNVFFQKTFVHNPATELIGVGLPKDLTTGQVGFFNAKTGVGATLTPTNITNPVIIIHQNLGDNKFGTTRTKSLSVQKVDSWYAVKAAPAVDQITYVGYDEVDGTKTLTAYYGQFVELVITIYSNVIKQWYGGTGYTERIPLDLALCAACIADCTAIDPDTIADFYVAYINGTLAPVGAFPSATELSNWIVASKVATGTQGAVDRRVGIKLVGKPQPPVLLAACDPQQSYEAQLLTFTVGVPYNCPNFPITTTVKAKTGNGYPLEVAELERESQGYDRVRDQSDDTDYMKPNFIIRAVDGAKYDFYYLTVQVTHRNTAIPGETSDPYIIIFPVPTGTGAKLETLINGWLTPLGFDAVTIAAAAGKGSAVPQLNA